MGLIEKLFGTVERIETPEEPDPVFVKESPTGVYAPCEGELISMSRLPDPVFSSGVMGPSIGIKPKEGVVYAPFSGTITVTTKTLHAIGLRSDSGIELLIHVGVDTVNLRGKGFHGFVEEGQHVVAGQPLMVMDLGEIERAGYSDVVIIVIINADAFSSIVPADEGAVQAGSQVMTAQA